MSGQTTQSGEKQSVALVSMVASAILAAAKFVVAMLTGSLGILSEAIHSLIDFGSTIITWFAIRWADRPADEDHHYGHAKVESIAALVETGLLFLTTGWIIYEAIHRLLADPTPVDVTWWAMAVIGASIIIDFNRARALKRVADATSSQALEADALHFSSDMWSSAVVLVGLALVALGVPMADSIAALVVSGFVAKAGLELGKRTLATLLDTAPEGATEKITTIAEACHGVLNVKLLRVRPAGPTLFVSVIVEVARTMAVDDMVKLRNDLGDKIREHFPMADVVVTTDPVVLDSETVFDKITLIASQRNLSIHHLTVQQIEGHMAVSFDIEFEGATTLFIAHEKATELEEAIRSELGEDVEVESHIEPQPLRYLAGEAAPAAKTKAVEAALRRLAKPLKTMTDIHNIRIRTADGGLFVHYHCRFDSEDSVEEVHTVIDGLENDLVAKFPEIKRVVAHAEPIGRARHRL